MDYHHIVGIFFFIAGVLIIIRGQVDNILLLTLVLGFPVIQLALGNDFNTMWPHFVSGGLGFIAAIFGFIYIGSAGLWKLIAVLLLWLPAFLMPDTIIALIMISLICGLLSLGKIKIGQFALEHFAGIISISSALIAFNGGITDFI